jgi:hypothetical protein
MISSTAETQAKVSPTPFRSYPLQTSIIIDQVHQNLVKALIQEPPEPSTLGMVSQSG